MPGRFFTAGRDWFRLRLPIYSRAVRVRAIAFWDWSATWNWWTIGTSGALSSMAKFGEEALGIALLSVSVFGLVSKISHSKKMITLSRSEQRFWKGLGMLCVFLFFVYLSALIAYTAVREDSWSNAPRMLAFMESARSSPSAQFLRLQIRYPAADPSKDGILSSLITLIHRSNRSATKIRSAAPIPPLTVSPEAACVPPPTDS